MAVQRATGPETVAAVATKVDDVNEAVNAELMRGPLATGVAVGVHVYAYQ
jgi:hypothetical protein